MPYKKKFYKKSCIKKYYKKQCYKKITDPANGLPNSHIRWNFLLSRLVKLVYKFRSKYLLLNNAY